MVHQSGFDSTVLHGWHYYWKSTDLPELSDDLIDVLVDHAFAAESPRSYAVIFHPGGVVSRISENATAYAGRNAPHNININGVWRPDEDFAESDTEWTREFFEALKPHRESVYVNFLDADDDTQRVREAYGEHTYRRLAELKADTTPTTYSTSTRTSNQRPEGYLSSVETRVRCSGAMRARSHSPVRPIWKSAGCFSQIRQLNTCSWPCLDV
ncbi:hypothetical protein SAMN04487948_11111 [Halogranum amylolyticum]|uniref:Uncharacterized protein n=1 Tax=Halogranum amylolyticum TaxID=660520 RepID=A0A1H8UGW2_9EURY|nr:hypothetical protein [Halogranum amylolyticum]SEP02336.1 hypothetical protein SAMN04487948_11111 [Halogranum amylolyticum]